MKWPDLSEHNGAAWGDRERHEMTVLPLTGDFLAGCSEEGLKRLDEAGFVRAALRDGQGRLLAVRLRHDRERRLTASQLQAAFPRLVMRPVDRIPEISDRSDDLPWQWVWLATAVEEAALPEPVRELMKTEKVFLYAPRRLTRENLAGAWETLGEPEPVWKKPVTPVWLGFGGVVLGAPAGAVSLKEIRDMRRTLKESLGKRDDAGLDLPGARKHASLNGVRRMVNDDARKIWNAAGVYLEAKRTATARWRVFEDSIDFRSVKKLRRAFGNKSSLWPAPSVSGDFKDGRFLLGHLTEAVVRDLHPSGIGRKKFYGSCDLFIAGAGYQAYTVALRERLKGIRTLDDFVQTVRASAEHDMRMAATLFVTNVVALMVDRDEGARRLDAFEPAAFRESRVAYRLEKIPPSYFSKAVDIIRDALKQAGYAQAADDIFCFLDAGSIAEALEEKVREKREFHEKWHSVSDEADSIRELAARRLEEDHPNATDVSQEVVKDAFLEGVFRWTEDIFEKTGRLPLSRVTGMKTGHVMSRVISRLEAFADEKMQRKIESWRRETAADPDDDAESRQRFQVARQVVERLGLREDDGILKNALAVDLLRLAGSYIDAVFWVHDIEKDANPLVAAGQIEHHDTLWRCLQDWEQRGREARKSRKNGEEVDLTPWRIRQPDPEAVDLRHMKRTGPQRRENDRDVTEAEVIATFGLSGIQYGNWVRAAERQAMLNRLYDTFMDMADALELPPSFLGLGGLGIAFGARGRGGRTTAHYEPDLHVINLTRTTGAGSFAHEWCHALDSFLAGALGRGVMLSEHSSGELLPSCILDRLDVDDVGKLASPRFGMESVMEYFMASIKRQEELAPEKDVAADIARARVYRWVNDHVFSTGKNGALRPFLQESPEKAAAWVKRMQPFIDEVVERFAADIVSTSFTPHNIRHLFVEGGYFSKSRLIDQIDAVLVERGGAPLSEEERKDCETWIRYEDWRALHREVIGSGRRGGRSAAKSEKSELDCATTFFKNARLLDDNRSEPYWSTDRELLARALSTVIHRLLERKGIVNEYASAWSAPGRYSKENGYLFSPNPEGEEVERFVEIAGPLIGHIRRLANAWEAMQEQMGVEKIPPTLEGEALKAAAARRIEKSAAALKNAVQALDVARQALSSPIGAEDLIDDYFGEDWFVNEPEAAAKITARFLDVPKRLRAVDGDIAVAFCNDEGFAPAVMVRAGDRLFRVNKPGRQPTFVDLDRLRRLLDQAEAEESAGMGMA